MAVGTSSARPSRSNRDLARTPHSGAVRIIIGPAAPEVIPSPSDPISCSER